MANFLIMGAGAVGGYFGSRLAEAGHSVYLVARGRHLQALVNDGLRVKTPEGVFHKKLPASENPASFGIVPDFIVFTVKSYDTLDALGQVRPLMGGNSQILSLQNGVENYDILAQVFGTDRVIRGFCRLNAELTGPGVIRQQKFAQIIFGEDDASVTPRVEQLAASLHQSGIDFRVSADIRRDMWTKFTWNAVHNVLTGLLGKTIIDLYKDEAMVSLMHRMTGEILTVAQAAGVDLRREDVDQVVEDGIQLGAFRTSTFQDRERGKPMEFDAFTGTMVRYGVRLGVPTPVFETLDALYRGLADS
jgi:2-dehydropantoate 2-reductase